MCPSCHRPSGGVDALRSFLQNGFWCTGGTGSLSGACCRNRFDRVDGRGHPGPCRAAVWQRLNRGARLRRHNRRYKGIISQSHIGSGADQPSMPAGIPNLRSDACLIAGRNRQCPEGPSLTNLSPSPLRNAADRDGALASMPSVARIFAIALADRGRSFSRKTRSHRSAFDGASGLLSSVGSWSSSIK